MPSRVIFFVVICLIAALVGCSNPPEFGDHEARVFHRPASLIDLAVLDSGVAPNAEKKDFKKQGIVDFDTRSGRIIRVELVKRPDLTKVYVTHAGAGGAKGAKEVIDKIEAWLRHTDGFRNQPHPLKRGVPPSPRRP